MTLKNNLAEYAAKKGFEIGYVVFRLADSIRQSGRREFAETLENLSLAMLKSIYLAEFADAAGKIEAFCRILEFGAGVGVISQANADVLIAELKELDSLACENNQRLPDVNVASAFSELRQDGHGQKYDRANKELLAVAEENVEEQNDHDHDDDDDDDNDTAKVANQQQQANPAATSPGGGPAIRQSIILDRIRQTQNCRMKDIQDFLPDSSERTIRYDLQELIRQNKIIRIGNGGPSTSYQVAGMEDLPHSFYAHHPARQELSANIPAE